MQDQNLTKAYIQSTENLKTIDLPKELRDLKSFIDSKKVLIIQSTSDKCIRITIYPVQRDAIVKLSLIGANISDDSIEALSSVLHNYNIIHTSVLLIKTIS